MGPDKLIEICARHVLPRTIPAILPEPYIPFVPETWNGVLVLGEAQHLGKRNLSYRTWLLGADRLTRFTRFRLENDALGIAPWDDGTLRFAVEASLGLLAEECAVSNAVPWSQVSENDDNANPSRELIKLAGRFWEEMLPALAPTRIIACGGMAHSVFKPLVATAGGPSRFLFPRLPSPRSTPALVKQYPEALVVSRSPAIVQKAMDRPEWLVKYRANKLAYAYHLTTLEAAARSGPR